MKKVLLIVIISLSLSSCNLIKEKKIKIKKSEENILGMNCEVKETSENILKYAFSKDLDKFTLTSFKTLNEKENKYLNIFVNEKGENISKDNYITIQNLMYSDDGKDLYYTARNKENKYVVVKNHEELPGAYLSVSNFGITDDGSSYFFNDKDKLIINGKEKKLNHFPLKLIYDKKHNKIGYYYQLGGTIAQDGESDTLKSGIYYDGYEKEINGTVYNFNISPDGNSYSYLIRKNNQKYVAIINGKESEEYEGINNFSYIGEKNDFIMKVNKKNGEYIFVKNWDESKGYNLIYDVKYLNDGKNILYSLKESDKNIYLYNNNHKLGEGYKKIEKINYSPLLNSYSYLAKIDNGLNNEEYILVKDGEKIILNGSLPPIRHIQYGEKNNKYVFMKDSNNNNINKLQIYLCESDKNDNERLEQINFSNIKTENNVFSLKGNTIEKRQKYMLAKYSVNDYKSLNIWKDVSNESKINTNLLLCIGYEASKLGYLEPYGKYNIALMHNINNNNYQTPKDGIKSIAESLNNSYLKDYNTLDMLSRYGNNTGPIYDDSNSDWHYSIKWCIEALEGKKITDNYNFRLD